MSGQSLSSASENDVNVSEKYVRPMQYQTKLWTSILHCIMMGNYNIQSD